jgi:formylglycine-generating enzyme required for sulfatase activity
MVAWYYKNSNKKTHAVGTKSPNELGIYDMSGNVWEWCSDWYNNYETGAVVNPQGASTGSVRVLRGGSWYYVARHCRISGRFSYSPGYHNYNLGFRLAASP